MSGILDQQDEFGDHGRLDLAFQVEGANGGHACAAVAALGMFEVLAQAHARARAAGADAVADHVLEIVDTEPERYEGKIDNGSIAWARNRAEYRLKLLGHWRPEKYGTKTTAEITGKDGKELPNVPDAAEVALAVAAALRAAKRDY